MAEKCKQCGSDAVAYGFCSYACEKKYKEENEDNT